MHLPKRISDPRVAATILLLAVAAVLLFTRLFGETGLRDLSEVPSVDDPPVPQTTPVPDPAEPSLHRDWVRQVETVTGITFSVPASYEAADDNGSIDDPASGVGEFDAFYLFDTDYPISGAELFIVEVYSDASIERARSALGDRLFGLNDLIKYKPNEVMHILQQRHGTDCAESFERFLDLETYPQEEESSCVVVPFHRTVALRIVGSDDLLAGRWYPSNVALEYVFVKAQKVILLRREFYVFPEEVAFGDPTLDDLITMKRKIRGDIKDVRVEAEVRTFEEIVASIQNL